MKSNTAILLTALVVVAAACAGTTTDTADSVGDQAATAPTTTVAPTTTTTTTTTVAPTTTTTTTTTMAPTTTTVPPRPGVLTLEFGEWFLTYPVDDCPVEFLSTVGGFWVVPDPRVTIEGVPAENIDGEIWTIEVGMSWAITEEGGTAVPIVNVIAAAPGDKPYYIGNPSKVAVDAEFTDQKATYVTTFVNAVFDGPDELAATVTMTCDE